MKVITKKELLQGAKEYLSAELNRVQDELNKLYKEKKEASISVHIPAFVIDKIMKYTDATSNQVATILGVFLSSNVKEELVDIEVDFTGVVNQQMVTFRAKVKN